MSHAIDAPPRDAADARDDRRPLTSANEPDEFFASDFESMAPEEKLKDPLVLLGLGSIFLPFIMILGFQATGPSAASEIFRRLLSRLRYAIDVATAARWRGE